jgi:hypothetical protein
MNLLYITFGIIIGLTYSYIVLPPGEKDCPTISPTFYPILHNGMVKIPICRKKVFHIHHWMFYGFILLFSYYLNPIVIGFSIVLVCQGLMYSDSFEFFEDIPIGYS